jgi:ABC-type uncharacterized transport system ATPase subunit
MSLLSFTDASKSYGDVPVLNGIKAGGLGGGNQQKIIIEPTRGVDIDAKQQISLR